MKKLFEKFFLSYIRFFAVLELKKVKPYIIGITGSVGKSSVRDAITTVLQDEYPVKVTGKANSETGIPLDILGLEMRDYSSLDWLRVSLLAPLALLFRKEKYEKYIVEMGVDSPYEPKNMSYLLKILKPNTAVFVNVHSVHSEAFDKEVSETDLEKRKDLIVKKIAQEKGKLIQSVETGGYVVVNAKDENVMGMVKGCKGEVVTVGGEDSVVSYSNVQCDLNGFKCSFAIDYMGKKDRLDLYIKDQVLGPHYAMTFGLAIAVGVTQGIEFKKCVKALENYKLPPGRMSLLKGIKGSYIIDSSYNASGSAVIDALQVLNDVSNGREKIAVIGDMRELGAEAEIEHKRIAKKLFEVAEKIVLVGPLTKKYVFDEILNRGFLKENIHWFENSFLAKDFVRDLIQGDEVILVKGSQNTIFLERVVEEIMLNKDEVDKLLCRRGKYWDNIRGKFV